MIYGGPSYGFTPDLAKSISAIDVDLNVADIHTSQPGSLYRFERVTETAC